MATDPTNWEHVLPVSRFEMWILRVVMLLAIFGSGFGLGLFYTRHDFERGETYMQKAYTTGGQVLRVKEYKE